MRRVSSVMAVALVLAVPAVAGAQAVDRLEFVARPRLIECKGVPCFQLDLNAVGANDQLINIDTQGGRDRWQVTRGGVPQKVFYVAAKESDRTKGPGRGRYLLLLIDISGTMNYPVDRNDTRFTAAKKAVSAWASSLKEGVDHVAIVPFESHEVVSTIKGATFADSVAQVRREIEALPVPQMRNNTALFTAVVTGLDLLAEKYQKKGEEPVLLVFTDGENDVRADDDRGLLGAEGLEIARAKAHRLGIPLFTIGFGVPGQRGFDEQSLRSLAYPTPSNYSRVSNGAELQQVLEKARSKVTSGVQLFVGPMAETTKAEFAGQTVGFKVSYTAGGQTLESVKETPWVTVGMTEPGWDGHLTPGTPEWTALLDSLGDSTNGPPPEFIRPLVLVMYGAILALLWFGVPRIVWPERYMARPAPPPPQVKPPAPQWPQAPRPGPPPARPGPPPQRPGPQAQRPGPQAPAPPEQTVYIRPDTGKYRPPDKPGPKR